MAHNNKKVACRFISIILCLVVSIAILCPPLLAASGNIGKSPEAIANTGNITSRNKIINADNNKSLNQNTTERAVQKSNKNNEKRADEILIVKDVRHWAAPDNIRVVVDVAGNFSYTMRSDERRIVFNLPQARLGASTPRALEINADPLRALLIKQKWDNSVELEIFLSRPARFKAFPLPPWEGKPYRLVVDVETGLNFTKSEKKEKREQSEKIEKQAKQVPSSAYGVPAKAQTPPKAQALRSPNVIIIDAGHGGEDPGAIGLRGAQEKTLTLDISKRIAQTLGKDPRYEVFLTRNGDYYVSFRKRTALAHQKGAALFLSIHVDAALGRKATGASVYVLSLGGASNEAARLLAQWENLADLVGGVEEAERREESDVIVLSMFQTQTINSSLQFGEMLLKRLCRVAKLKYKEPQSARFRVLMLPDVPSLLVETGFISNPQEEALLRTAAYRQKLATAIAATIKDFLNKASL